MGTPCSSEGAAAAAATPKPSAPGPAASATALARSQSAGCAIDCALPARANLWANFTKAFVNKRLQPSRSPMKFKLSSCPVHLLLENTLGTTPATAARKYDCSFHTQSALSLQQPLHQCWKRSPCKSPFAMVSKITRLSWDALSLPLQKTSNRAFLRRRCSAGAGPRR